MKNIKLITILALSSAVLFGGKATAHKAKVNFKETVVARSESSGSIADLVIDSDKAIHGLQFDISFNPSEIKSVQPEAISGFEVKYNEISEGVIRGLIFSMQGQALPENLKFEFLNADGFEGTSTIEFKDIILADNQGNGIEVEVISFEWLVKRLAAEGICYLLDHKGDPASGIDLCADSVFILSDHVPMPRKSFNSMKRQGVKTVSLGSTLLFASQCITLLHQLVESPG